MTTLLSVVLCVFAVQSPRGALRRSHSHRSPRGSPRSSRHTRGSSLAKAISLAPGDIEELPLEQLVDQVIEAWSQEAQRLEARIEELLDKVREL